jgi:hypothetical protein
VVTKKLPADPISWIAKLLFEFISLSKPQKGIVTEKADFNEKELHWAKSGYVSDSNNILKSLPIIVIIGHWFGDFV